MIISLEERAFCDRAGRERALNSSTFNSIYRNSKDAPLHLPTLLAPSLDATLHSSALRGSPADLETGKPTEIVKRITKEDLICNHNRFCVDGKGSSGDFEVSGPMGSDSWQLYMLGFFSYTGQKSGVFAILSHVENDSRFINGPNPGQLFKEWPWH